MDSIILEVYDLGWSWENISYFENMHWKGEETIEHYITCVPNYNWDCLYIVLCVGKIQQLTSDS